MNSSLLGSPLVAAHYPPPGDFSLKAKLGERPLTPYARPEDKVFFMKKFDGTSPITEQESPSEGSGSLIDSPFITIGDSPRIEAISGSPLVDLDSDSSERIYEVFRKMMVKPLYALCETEVILDNPQDIPFVVIFRAWGKERRIEMPKGASLSSLSAFRAEEVLFRTKRHISLPLQMEDLDGSDLKVVIREDRVEAFCVADPEEACEVRFNLENPDQIPFRMVFKLPGTKREVEVLGSELVTKISGFRKETVQFVTETGQSKPLLIKDLENGLVTVTIEKERVIARQIPPSVFQLKVENQGIPFLVHHRMDGENEFTEISSESQPLTEIRGAPDETICFEANDLQSDPFKLGEYDRKLVILSIHDDRLRVKAIENRSFTPQPHKEVKRECPQLQIGRARSFPTDLLRKV